MRANRIIALVALLLAAISIFLSAVLFTRLASTTDRTDRSLCSLRADLQQRIANTETFLAEHPEGIPGIPAATLRQSLDGQRRTVKALGPLDCPPPNLQPSKGRTP